MTISEQLNVRRVENIRTTTPLYVETTPEGVIWQYVHVPDRYTDNSENALALRQQISEWNTALHEGAVSRDVPRVIEGGSGQKILEVKNSVSEEVYANPAMRYWRAELVPSALALVPLQDPTGEALPGDDMFIIDDVSRQFFCHSLDALAIRSRAAIMQDIASSAVSVQSITNRSVKMVSVASGTATPVIGAIERLDVDIPVELTLVDVDQRAHDMAERFIDHACLPHLTFESHFNNIMKDLVATDRLVAELGEEQADFVDAMGIFEYIPSKKNRAADFLRNTFRLVRPGGTLVLGNMLDTHPELDFNKFGIGWPYIHPRSRQELLGLVEDAGISLSNVIGHQAEDGVYAVIEVRKPGES